MNTFNLYKNKSEYNIADSLADIFAAQEAEEASAKTLNTSDISDSAVKTILAKFPADENKVVKAGDKYSWLDKAGHNVSVERKSNEYVLAINHNFAGLFSNADWEISDINGMSVVASVVNSLTKHANILESKHPSLLEEVDSVLAFIETEFLKQASDLEYEDVDMSELDEPVEADMADVNDVDDVMDIDVYDLSKNPEASEVVERIISNYSNGNELSYAVKSEFGEERLGKASESKMKEGLDILVENFSHKAADEAEKELDKLGMSAEEVEDLGSKVYYKVSELLNARAENLLEIAFERMPKNTKYPRRVSLLQEHLEDPENSRVRKMYTE